MEELLKKTYDSELEYKLWVTKGSRFNANKRYLDQDKLSIKAIGYLTAYVLIINLLSLTPVIKSYISLSSDFLSVATIGLSILILVFSQIEASGDYKIKAEKMHSSAKEIGKIYNELEMFRYSDLSEETKYARYVTLTENYNSILDKYDNHDRIDFLLFKANNASYFKLNSFKVFNLKANYYFNSAFKYYFLIFCPIFVMLIMYLHRVA
jgi:hypothetical protein